MQVTVSTLVFWIFVLSIIGMLLAEYEFFEPPDEDSGEDDDGTFVSTCDASEGCLNGAQIFESHIETAIRYTFEDECTEGLSVAVETIGCKGSDITVHGCVNNYTETIPSMCGHHMNDKVVIPLLPREFVLEFSKEVYWAEGTVIIQDNDEKTCVSCAQVTIPDCTRSPLFTFE